MEDEWQDARVLPAGLHRRRNREDLVRPWGDNERDRTAENTGYRPLDRLYAGIVVAVVGMLAVDVTAIENERQRSVATKDRFVLGDHPAIATMGRRIHQKSTCVS